jgi:phospholipid transport system substrate-binding protein
LNLFRLSKGTVLALSLAAAPACLAARAADDAGGFIGGLGDQTLALLRSKDASPAERERKFAQLADRAFDVPRISRFVLGRYWTSTSEDERKQFSQAFERYMIDVYWQRFKEYSGETFRVTGERADEAGTSTVITEVQRPNGQPPAKVEWSVAKVDNGYKIRDVSIEGISQALTYRQEFASTIERNGGKVSGLIGELRSKTPG